MPPIASRISVCTALTASRTPLPPIPALVAVAQLHGLVGAGRGARRHGRAPERAVLEQHVHLDGGVAPAVQDLAGGDVGDRGHDGSLPVRG